MIRKIILFVLVGLFLLSGLALAATTATTNSSKTVDLVCMQSAVSKRDSAIISAWDKLSAAIKSALSSRKDALIAAYKLTEKKERRAAIVQAWKDFRAAQSAARKTYRLERSAAWKTYKSDAKACRGQGEDLTGEGVDNLSL